MSSPVQNAALVSPGLVTPTAPAAPAPGAAAPLTGPSFAEVLAQLPDGIAESIFEIDEGFESPYFYS